MGDSNTHLTTTSTTGWSRCLLHTSFDERRVRLDPSIVARTGFWLSFFRFQGATTHTTEVGGVKYTISGFLRRTTVGSPQRQRSEEHTSELQSRQYLVCRLLLE